MATPTTKPTTGIPRKLGRYTADTGDRRIIGQRIDGTVQLRDEPATGSGRSYLIEPELTSMGELQAIVEDYLVKAKRLGYVPMHGWW